VILPVLIGTALGAFVGNAYGQVKGFTTALVPLTLDPSLEAHYRRTIGAMSPSHRADFDGLMAVAQEQREPLARQGFVPLYRDMSLPPAPPRPRAPAATGGGIWNAHGYRPTPQAFYGPHATGGGIFTAHGYRPAPPGFYGSYAAGGGLFTYHGYRPYPPAFYG